MSARRCSPSGHEELKSKSGEWRALELIGVQDFGPPSVPLELRNCDHCHSTLAKELPR